MPTPDLVALALRPLPRDGVMRQRRALAGALALALIWSLLWGGWHRALHADHLAHARAQVPVIAAGSSLANGRAVAPASSQEPAAPDATGHEAGSEDCRLLDQLLLVDALASVPVLADAPPTEAAACPSVDPATAAARAPLPYQARAPPAP